MKVLYKLSFTIRHKHNAAHLSNQAKYGGEDVISECLWEIFTAQQPFKFQSFLNGFRLLSTKDSNNLWFLMLMHLCGVNE